MTDSSKWDELARRAQSGDKAAYHALLKAIAPYIRNVITPGLANADWADDLVQDVLMGVHKSLARYLAEQPFRPWLNAIIRYRRAEFFRRYYDRKGHLSVSLDDTDEIVEGSIDPIAELQQLQGIETALAQLSLSQQQVVQLLRIEGYSVKQVAQKTGMSESAVKVTAHRGANKLKALLIDRSE